MTRAQLIDQTVRRRFPHPIAAAWHRSALATNDADRIKRLLHCLEIVARHLASTLIADYLLGPADAAVDKHLDKLDKPSLGHWIGTIRSIVRHLRTRKEPAPFMPEAHDWYLTKGRPSDHAKLLDKLVELRNDEAHGRALSATETADRARRLRSEMQLLFRSISWLSAYRPFRVLEVSLARRGGFEGRVQFLTGVEDLTEPIPATWKARLLEECVYLTNPTGDRILEISPLVQVRHDDGPRADRCFLLHSTKKGKMLNLRNDSTGTVETTLIELDDKEIPWDEWLEGRADYVHLLDNSGREEAFRAPEYSPSDSAELGPRFEVRGELGAGGMATVYLVWDKWEEAQFALKVLHEQLAEEVGFRERFKREARTMKRLKHPHILRVEETSQLDDGRLYLKLPVMKSGTLSDRIKAGATPEDTVFKWAHQMISALAYMHERGIVHRDIKPSNYLLDEEDNVYLSDFGIALGETDTRLTRSLEQIGSLAYMSPEQRRGQEALASSDIYSLGLVLHELATGDSGAVKPGKGVPGLLGALIKDMCNELAEQRPSAEEALARLPKAAPPPPPPSADPMYTYQGPEGQDLVTLGELARRVQDAPNAPHLVWQAGWSGWKHWMELPEVVELVQSPPRMDRVGRVPIELVRGDPGTFALGPCEVTLTRGYELQEAPLTKALWHAIVLGDDTLEDGGQPVTGLSWFEAVELCNALSAKLKLPNAYAFAEPKLRKRYSLDQMGRALYDLVPFKLIPQVLATFGKQTLHVVQFELERLREVPGLGDKTIETIEEGWDPDKYFIRTVQWDRESPGWRLPTEAEYAQLFGEAQGELWEWVYDLDAHPKFAVDPSPLPDAPRTDWSGAKKGHRHVIRKGPERHCRISADKPEDVGFRLARTRL